MPQALHDSASYLCELCESGASRINLYRINLYHAILYYAKALEQKIALIIYQEAHFDKFIEICHTHKNVTLQYLQ